MSTCAPHVAPSALAQECTRTQIMQGMGPQKKLRKRSSALRFFSSSSFQPCSARSAATAASGTPADLSAAATKAAYSAACLFLPCTAAAASPPSFAEAKAIVCERFISLQRPPLLPAHERVQARAPARQPAQWLQAAPAELMAKGNTQARLE